jgi:hypothetical protein
VPKKIDAAVRERALRLFADHRQDYPSDTALAEAVAKKVGVGTSMPASGRGRELQPITTTSPPARGRLGLGSTCLVASSRQMRR